MSYTYYSLQHHVKGAVKNVKRRERKEFLKVKSKVQNLLTWVEFKQCVQTRFIFNFVPFALKFNESYYTWKITPLGNIVLNKRVFIM